MPLHSRPERGVWSAATLVVGRPKLRSGQHLGSWNPAVVFHGALALLGSRSKEVFTRTASDIIGSGGSILTRFGFNPVKLMGSNGTVIDLGPAAEPGARRRGP